MAVKAELVEASWFYAWHPVELAEDLLGVRPDPKQAAVLCDLAEHRCVAVRSGHGVGKTLTAAVAVLWWLLFRPFAKVACTAPTQHQLHDLLWAEISRLVHGSRFASGLLEVTDTRVYRKGMKNIWFAAARTANKPEGLAGRHGDWLLYVVDEASGVPDQTMQVVDGALTTKGARLLMLGNPTRRNGYFFDAFHKDRAAWRLHHISSEESPWVDPEYPKAMAAKWGRDSDVYRVRVLGEFPKGEEDTFIGLELVEVAQAREAEPEGAVACIGVDVARFGEDETAICIRRGHHVPPLDCRRGQDTQETAGRVLAHARRLLEEGAGRVVVCVDDTGVGGGVTDALRGSIAELGLKGITVRACNFGGSGDGKHYDDAATWWWAEVRDALKEGLALPRDEDLAGQLASRKFAVTRRGTIRLESKAEMKRRGLPSPDRADALALTFAAREGAAQVTAATVPPPPIKRERRSLIWGSGRD